MDTTIVRADSTSISRAAELIRAGELVVFPTETVYGLGADAFNAQAVGKIFRAKGRPQDNPLIVHISDIEQVGQLASHIPDELYLLADRFMPGPLTVILPKSAKVPYEVTAGGETVGIRMPDNAIARQLISLSGPIAAPSANRSKHISPTTAQHVYEDLNGEVGLILDGGACRVGIESTVLDLTANSPTILRPGAITAAMLAQVLGQIDENGKVIKIAKSPGMKYQHYAPTVPAVVASDIPSAIAEYDAHINERPVILARERAREQTGDRRFISLGEGGFENARRIYSALHEAEKRYGYIIIERLDGEGIEASVMNRIMKAAGGKTV